MMQHSPERQPAPQAATHDAPSVNTERTGTSQATNAMTAAETASDPRVEAAQAVRLSVPEMDLHNLPAYFCALEHWFAATGITAKMDHKRYHVLMAQIPLRVYNEIQPIIENVPATERYNYIKRNILQHFGESQRSRLHRLLYGMDLGDRKPSQLLAEMHRASSDTLASTLLTDLWINKLPPHVQSAVVAAPGSVTEKAAVADTMVECLSASNNASVHHAVAGVRTTPNDFEQRISRQVDELTQQLNDFITECRNREQRQSRPRPRPPVPSRVGTEPSEGECYYHRRYGTAARTCRQPCSFPAPVSQRVGQPSSSA
uniref:uncharacterized protein LOC120956129 n=1 Tax=Anopheles coluzzii TaxID=1518534 RepID=UPI0020FFF470|nr:uncharacterized protein LOC120956129 [Anopheles coluzzii]